MKTKDKYKMSGSEDRRICGLRLFHDRWSGTRTANTAVRATPKSREQSQNVYENKGQVQNIVQAPEARLLSGQVIETGDALARVLSGLDWLASRNARICCLAMGFDRAEPIFSTVLQILRRRGMLVVAPIGNGGAGRALSPACEPGALSVGASDEAGRIASFSGSVMSGMACVAPLVVAPAEGIVAAASRPGDLVTCNGTSYAAAYVAGVAALLLQARPEAGPEELIHAVTTTARPVTDAQSHRCATGFIAPLPALHCLLSERPAPAAKAPWHRDPSSSAAHDPRLAVQMESGSDDSKIHAFIGFHADQDLRAGDFKAFAAQFLAEASQATRQTPLRSTVLPWLKIVLVNAPRRWLRYALAHQSVALSGPTNVFTASSPAPSRIPAYPVFP
jgi:hypothetical protein